MQGLRLGCCIIQSYQKVILISHSVSFLFGSKNGISNHVGKDVEIT